MSTKISQLATMASVDLANDVLPIVDTSEGTTKKVTPNLILEETNKNVKGLIKTQYFVGDVVAESKNIGYLKLDIAIPDGYYLRGVFTQLDTLGTSGVTSCGKVGSDYYATVYNFTSNTQTYTLSARAVFVKNLG